MPKCEWCGKPITQEQFEKQDGLCDKCHNDGEATDTVESTN